jgi:hypothetical protein
MKYLINYLLTALLAATALARPPSQLRDRGEHRADCLRGESANSLIVELPPGAYWEGDVLVLDPILDVDKRSEQPPGPFGDIDATKWANFANLSAVPDVTGLANEMGPHIAATVPPIPKDSKKLILETRIGGLNSYVGTLRKDRLEEAIYQCLTWSCPLDDPKRGMNECNGYNAWNPCKVNHIVYEGSAGKYHSDAGLYIWTNKAFHNPDLAGFGEAMVSHLRRPSPGKKMTKRTNAVCVVPRGSQSLPHVDRFRWQLPLGQLRHVTPDQTLQRRIPRNRRFPWLDR